MRASLEPLVPLAFGLGILALLPFTRPAVATLGRLREPMPCECIGPADATTRAVYLHGLDTPGPSWLEIQNRETLRALAAHLGVRIALPRRRGPWAGHDSSETTLSLAVIRSAAATCFAPRQSFGLIGFSDGGNFVNDLFARCETTGPRWFISIGSEGRLQALRQDLSRCRGIWVLAGRHEPFFAETRTYAHLLSKAGAHATFIEHPGPHELPYEETRLALEAVRQWP